MRLLDAIRMVPPFSLALTGAGGKSSVLFQLGREILKRNSAAEWGGVGSLHPDSVILSATTHLAAEQAALADWHITLGENKDWKDSDWGQRRGMVLITGPIGAAGSRTAGLNPVQISSIRRYAAERGAALIIEADGSRRRPLKAPASHEPVIPEWVDGVMVVAGLSGIGKPLSEDWVFRPEIFGKLTGMLEEEIITPEHVRQVLCHPFGGLKGIPPEARRIALLNQAGTPDLQAAAKKISGELMAHYSPVVTANLPFENQDPHPAPCQGVIAVHEPVAAVVLAAGGALRFGELKQMLVWQGKPLVRHVVESAHQAGLTPVIVVIGAEPDRVRTSMGELAVQIVENNAWSSGLASSVRAGIGVLSAEVGAAVFLLADQPQVSPSLLRSLVEAHSVGLHPIVAPIVNGQRGNPVLFDRRTFSALSKLSGDIGGRGIFSDFPIQWLEWHDQNVLTDIDTPEDYDRLIRSTEENSPSSAR